MFVLILNVVLMMTASLMSIALMTTHVNQDAMKIQIVPICLAHLVETIMSVLILNVVLMMIVRVHGYVRTMSASQSVLLMLIVILMSTVTLLKASVKKVAEMMLDVQQQIAQLV